MNFKQLEQVAHRGKEAGLSNEEISKFSIFLNALPHGDKICKIEAKEFKLRLSKYSGVSVYWDNKVQPPLEMNFNEHWVYLWVKGCRSDSPEAFDVEHLDVEHLDVALEYYSKFLDHYITVAPRLETFKWQSVKGLLPSFEMFSKEELGYQCYPNDGLLKVLMWDGKFVIQDAYFDTAEQEFISLSSTLEDATHWRKLPLPPAEIGGNHE
jgi:hypothetical protein